MAWLPIYADAADTASLLRMLNEDTDIAFITADGPARWRAVASLDQASDERHCLWHVPAGRLPLVRGGGVAAGVIDDPWTGWTDERTGADPALPYFGAGDPAILWWNVRTRGRGGGLGLSSFEWIGNRYAVLGTPAPATTESWWKRLLRGVARDAVKIPRNGPWDGESAEIWALPSALAAIRSGVPRDDNP